MKNSKKLLALLLAGIITSAALAGCGDSGNTTSGDSGKNASQGSSEGNNADLAVIRIMGIDKTATIGDGDVKLSDWENGDSKLWEKLTADLKEKGIELELNLIENDQYQTVCQTQLAAGIDSDLMNITPLDNQTRLNLVDQKKLVPMNTIYNEHSDGNAKDFFNTGNGAQSIKKLTMEDGNIYWLTDITINLDESDEVSIGSAMAFSIRKDWLDKLGMPVPTTADEFYNTLKAFQENDMNGNGEKDEVIHIEMEKFNTGIAQWFGLGTDLTYPDDSDGKVKSPWYHENMKAYIQFMQKLVRDGLVDTSDQSSEKKAENKIAGLFSWAGETWEEPGVTVQEGAAAPYFLPIIVKAVDNTEPYIPWQRGYQLGGNAYSVTNECKDLDAMGKLIDYLVSPEYRELTEWGIKDYTYQEDGAGKRTKITSGNSEVQVKASLPSLWTNGSIFPRYEIYSAQETADSINQIAITGKEMGYPETGFQEKADFISGNAEYAYKTPHETAPEYAVATKEELNTITELTSDLQTYSNELLTKLVLEQKSLDDWDSYMDDLARLGLDDMIKINQARFDRTK